MLSMPTLFPLLLLKPLRKCEIFIRSLVHPQPKFIPLIYHREPMSMSLCLRGRIVALSLEVRPRVVLLLCKAGILFWVGGISSELVTFDLFVGARVRWVGLGSGRFGAMGRILSDGQQNSTRGVVLHFLFFPFDRVVVLLLGAVVDHSEG